MLDLPNVEFLRVCRMVLKGECNDLDLVRAIQKARKNLQTIKNEFLSQAASQEKTLRLTRMEADAVLVSFQSYSKGVETIEHYLSSRNRVVLARGMEQVRQAIERIETAFHRYHVALLAVHGPTDMPGYNFLANAVQEYQQDKMTKNDLETLIRAAHFSVKKSLDSLASHIHLPEVEKLNEAYLLHQQALEELKDQLSRGNPIHEGMARFQKSWELIWERKIPAEVKILSETPTPSSAANFMINTAKELISGNIHPSYFVEALKDVKIQRELFTDQLKELQLASPDSKRVQQTVAKGREALALYSDAIDRFMKFQETMETKHLPPASMMLQKAVLQLYEVFKALRTRL